MVYRYRSLVKKTAIVFIITVTLPILQTSAFKIKENTLLKSTISLQNKQWTFIIYMDADNDLEKAALKSINSMEYSGSNKDINIIVQLDTKTIFKGVRRYYITKDMDAWSIRSEIIQNLSEKDMGNPDTLVDFVEWTIKHYPARRYCLVLWDHGNGWQGGICYDETSKSHLSMLDLKQAMNEIKKFNDKNIDLILFDACLMGMLEVYYQIRETTDVIVGSEDVIWGEGCPYHMILHDLKNKPESNASTLGKIIIENYADYYSSFSIAMGAFYNNLLADNIVNKLDSLAQLLIENTKEYKKEIKKAIEETKTFDVGDYKTNYRDLYDFAQEIKNLVPDKDVKEAAGELMKSIDNTKIFSTQNKNRGAYGLSIYLPVKKSDYKDEYNTIDLSIATHWDDFIRKYIKTNNAKSLIPVHIFSKKLWGFLL
ncbi:MAG TPA: hypothetical protein ENG24_01590 [Thermoplasmatales archaeon]|nr:hypothetical protein [Thermoplasmatales archaeon]